MVTSEFSKNAADKKRMLMSEVDNANCDFGH